MVLRGTFQTRSGRRNAQFFPRDAATLVVNGTDAHPILSGSSPKGGGGKKGRHQAA